MNIAVHSFKLSSGLGNQETNHEHNKVVQSANDQICSYVFLFLFCFCHMPFFVAVILYFQTWGCLFYSSCCYSLQTSIYFSSICLTFADIAHCMLHVVALCPWSRARLALMMVLDFYFPSPSLFLLHCSTNHLHPPPCILVLHSSHTPWQIYIYDLTRLLPKVKIQACGEFSNCVSPTLLRYLSFFIYSCC